MSTFRMFSFSGGELAPSLYARPDLFKYSTGLRTCRNIFVLRHGGASNRSGTRFIAEVKDSSKVVRLAKFVFNVAQTYVLEFGDLYMRVYRNQAQIRESAQTITDVTQASPAVVTIAAHGYSNGDEVFIDGVVGMTRLNGRNFLVSAVTTNTFELQNLDGTSVSAIEFDAYVSGGTAAKVFELTTPFAAADLATLQFVQSADVLTVVHPSYAPREIARLADANWTISTVTFTPSIAAPGSPAVIGGTGTGRDWKYVVTAVKEITYEESLPSAEVTLSNKGDPTEAAPNEITWATVAGAAEYRIYRTRSVLAGTTAEDIFGFIGTAAGLRFNDSNIEPDFNTTPPTDLELFSATDEFPSAVTYYQQRLVLANSNDEPTTVWASKTAFFKNFTVRSPGQDDDAVVFAIVGRQVNRIKHLIDVGVLVIFTADGEWSIEGDAAGILIPTEPNPRQRAYHGSSDLAPVVIGNKVVFVQARGSVVRSFGFDFQVDGYRGDELSVFSAHLVDGFTISDMDYQQTAQSIIWFVRSDGTLLGLTIVPEHQMLAWHRHDTDGAFENVVTIPGTNEDEVWFVVRRTVNGQTRRYVELLVERDTSDQREMVFMDSSLEFDGRNTDTTHTMTLSGGTDWDHLEDLTLTSSESFFIAGDVGNEIHLTDTDGEVLRCEITAFTSATVVTVRAHKTVPVSLRDTATDDWARAVDVLEPLDHLEGKEVSVLGDGSVIGSPNNASYETLTVSGGRITLPVPKAVVQAGLPYISDLETLDVDTPEGQSLIDTKTLIDTVTVFVENTRGLWFGPKPPTDDDDDPLEGLIEPKIRNEEDYDDPIALVTDKIVQPIHAEWNANGRVFVRQIDPLPMTILSIAPSGFIGRGS